MYIPKIINNRYTKQFLFFSALAVPTILISRSCEEKIVNDMRQEIYVNDSLRYKRIDANTRNMNCFSQKPIWARELRNMKDSIKLDSVAKKAYFEGAQMVRDSINNTKNN